MTLLLHLTDIHLGGDPTAQVLDDYKLDLVPFGERTTRISLLESTLSELAAYLRHHDRSLDAIAITGDVTVQHDEEGFKQLDRLLGHLGDQLPSPEKIVVLPGNHDVAWRTKPGTTERYSHFLKYVRAKGYVTPLLDGVDTTLVGSSHFLSLANGTIELIPLNSANYSGILADAGTLNDTDVQQFLDSVDPSKKDALSRSLAHLRVHDMARISHWQLREWSSFLSARDRSNATGAEAIRIALIHHQLAPVSTSEEVKTFETLTNLGLLREFLRANGFHVLLHGHKHSSAIYRDEIYPYEQHLMSDLQPHSVLVVSGSTIGGSDYHRGDVARLLEFTDSASAPEIVVSSVPAVDPGSRFQELTSRRFRLWASAPHSGDPRHKATPVRGRTVDEVYDRLMSILADLSPHDLAYDVLCEIEPAPHDVQLPTRYPEIPGKSGANRDLWFSELVDWWQRRRTVAGNSFTHGERIYAFGEQRLDQVAEVCRVLQKKLETSRAIINLFNPTVDTDPTDQRKAPHFCLIQFRVRRSTQHLLLDCFGFFRKQEMRYWWPVNVAELARIHEAVYERIRSKHPGLQKGSLSTLATLAYASSSCPKVAIPILDRVLDMDPDRIWMLAYALVCDEISDYAELSREWARLLDDLVPATIPDPDGVPVAISGLESLCREVARFARCHSSAELQSILSLLQLLLKENTAYAKSAASSDPTIEQHTDWRESSLGHVTQLREAIGRRFSQ